MPDFTNKKAIVLGGTSGIGLAASEMLRDAGAEVIAGSRRECHLDGIECVQVDVLDREALRTLFEKHDGFDYLVTGVGTGGHISGVSRVLKQKMPGIRVLAVEPAASPVISGGNPGKHPIMGIGAGFIPKNLDREVLDGVIQVEKEDAFAYAKRVAKEEGIFAGISTGASLAAVGKVLETASPDSRILTFNYDTGERYLSVEGLF